MEVRSASQTHFDIFTASCRRGLLQRYGGEETQGIGRIKLMHSMNRGKKNSPFSFKVQEFSGRPKKCVYCLFLRHCQQVAHGTPPEQFCLVPTEFIQGLVTRKRNEWFNTTPSCSVLFFSLIFSEWQSQPFLGTFTPQLVKLELLPIKGIGVF